MAFSIRLPMWSSSRSSLPLGGGDGQVRRDRVDQDADVFDPVQALGDVLGDVLARLREPLEIPLEPAGQGFETGVPSFARRLLAGGLQELRAVRVAQNPGARRSRHHDLQRPVRELDDVRHVRERAHPEQVVGSRVVVGGLFLGHQQNAGIGLRYRLQGAHRFHAPDQQRGGHARKHHVIPQGENRMHQVRIHRHRLRHRSYPFRTDGRGCRRARCAPRQARFNSFGAEPDAYMR